MTVTRLGLVINPIAGSGGEMALKGSDSLSLNDQVEAKQKVRAEKRCARMINRLPNDIVIVGFDGPMAGNAVRALGYKFESIGVTTEATDAADTERAAKLLIEHDVDLIVFVGGDGTARNMYNAVGNTVPVLGLPAGVKMHSGVFATSPEAAAEVVIAMRSGALVDIAEREVRDIDEDAFRKGKVKTRHYGELLVPSLGEFIQATKEAGKEVESLAVADIAAEVVETLEQDILYLIGPGSTTAAVMTELGLANTLLGVDAVLNDELVGSDLNAQQCLELSETHSTRIILTAIGGQGHLLGRGNQQFSPELLRRVGRGNLIVLATKTKLKELGGRPLLLDSNDAALDKEWCGFIRVVTGYRDEALVRVSNR